MATLMGVQRGFEVRVLDQVDEGLKPELVRDAGAEYATGSMAEVAEDGEPDVIVECTGVAELVVDAMRHTAPGSIVCLTGVAPRRELSVDVGSLNNELVLENDVVFGSVNANRRHFEAAVESLERADRRWLERMITRRVPFERWREALERHDGDVKNVIEIAA
jgi:glucose 1-dehydrogenase